MNKEELLLINLAVLEEKYLIKIIESDVISCMQDEKIKQILLEVVKKYEDCVDSYTDLLDEIKKDRAFDEVLNHLYKLESDKEGSILNECIRRIKYNHIKKQNNILTKELKIKDDPEKMKQFMDNMKKINILDFEDENEKLSIRGN